ncbi:hypothetical protein HPB50_006423 [Hyalomma asiaticum]|uniref:Uncharacterized protein n=1 Tax=Hyalomma asiaticum TaxID=266040 RepID=A0ACB7S559_HYAAI|nr:hypothetical protein HPB50_006423 [Hyalomma asiaticum]
MPSPPRRPLNNERKRSCATVVPEQGAGPRRAARPPSASFAKDSTSIAIGKPTACVAIAPAQEQPCPPAAADQPWLTRRASDLCSGVETECNVNSSDAPTTSEEAPATSWWPQHSLEEEPPRFHPTVQVGSREIVPERKRASLDTARETSQFPNRPHKEQAARERMMAEYREAELRSSRVLGQAMHKGTHGFQLIPGNGSLSRRQLGSKDSKPTSPLLVLTFCGGSCAVALGVTFVLFLAVAAIKRRPPAAHDVCRSHACAEFSRRLRESLNDSACPCKSFTSFVCDGWREGHKLSVREESFKAAFDRMSRMTSTLSSEREYDIEPVASTFFRSCESLFKGTSDETDAVSEALRHAGIVWPSRPQGPVDALEAVFISSLKLRWSAVLHVELNEQDGKTRVLLTPVQNFAISVEKALTFRGHDAARSDYFNLLSRNFAGSSTQAQDSVTLEETAEVERKFLIPLKKAFQSPSKRDVLEAHSLFIQSANLSSERWRKVLHAHDANINGEVIYWTEKAEFVEMFFTLWSNHGEWDVFLLLSWCTVQVAALYANRHLIVNYYGDEHTAAVMHGSFCLRKTYLIAGNAAFSYYRTDILLPRSRASAETMTIAVREAFLRRVQRWQYYDRNTTVVSEWNSTARVFAVIDGKYSGKFTGDAIRLPNMTTSFVQNWQMVRLPYAYYASNAVYDAIRQLQLYAILEDDFALLPYAFSFPLYAVDGSHTMNLAGVGREMAIALSELFFEAYASSGSARKAFSELNDCLQVPDSKVSLLEFLALDTLSEVHNSLGFQADRRPISLEKYSPSQLFFIAACYATCRGSSARGSHDHCDTVLRHLKSFSDAFLCSHDSAGSPKMCFF